MRHLLILAAAASLTACATQPRVWEKEGATPQTTSVDLVDCRRAARQEAFYEVPYLGIGGFSRFGPYYGYRPIRPYLGGADLRYDREVRLTAFCMRTKGYELVTLPPGPTVAPGIVPPTAPDAPPPAPSPPGRN